jgi:hypothetical protein
MQLIICVETNSSCNSDYLYISALLHHRYSFASPQPKLTPIYLSGKTHYADKESKINYYKNAYQGISHVIFCLDTDLDAPASLDNPSIEKYCQTRGYDLVWFNRDVEEVFLGHQIGHTTALKKKEAERFARNNGIAHLPQFDVEQPFPLIHGGLSNFAIVFDQYLTKK